MDASPEQLETLELLQKLDSGIAKTRKTFEEMPERTIILDVRKKRAELAARREKIDAMRVECEHKLTRLSDEDSSLANKQVEVQKLIDETKGDYRRIEARTKELNGFAKRRATLEDELLKLDAEQSKVAAALAQIDAADAKLADQEAAATKKFQTEGGQMKQVIGAAEAKRDRVRATLPAELLAAYDKACAMGGGIGFGALKGRTCGVCRSTIEDTRVTSMRAQGPLATCPRCKRLLRTDE